MNFELTMEQQQLKDSVTNFARQHLGGKLGAYDFNKYWNACSEFGLFEMPVPNDLEGLDIDPLAVSNAAENRARICDQSAGADRDDSCVGTR